MKLTSDENIDNNLIQGNENGRRKMSAVLRQMVRVRVSRARSSK